jgi:hypothetical protein
MTCLRNETSFGEGVIDENGMAINIRGVEHYSTDHASAFSYSHWHMVSEEDTRCQLQIYYRCIFAETRDFVTESEAKV